MGQTEKAYSIGEEKIAIFSCMCCERNLFESNVAKVDSKLITQIETKKKGLLKKAVELYNSEPLKTNIDGSEASYICLTCRGHLARYHLCPLKMV